EIRSCRAVDIFIQDSGTREEAPGSVSGKAASCRNRTAGSRSSQQKRVIAVERSGIERGVGSLLGCESRHLFHGVSAHKFRPTAGDDIEVERKGRTGGAS